MTEEQKAKLAKIKAKQELVKRIEKIERTIASKRGIIEKRRQEIAELERELATELEKL